MLQANINLEGVNDECPPAQFGISSLSLPRTSGNIACRISELGGPFEFSQTSFFVEKLHSETDA